MATFDDVLEEAGPFGRCQKRILALISLLPLTFSGYFAGIVFQGFTPDHWCRDSAVVDMRQVCGWSLEHTRNLTVPLSNTYGALQPSKCTRFDVDWNTTALGCDTETLNLTGVPVSTCEEGWEFDYEGRRTFVTEFNLVCSDSWLVDTFQSLLGVGRLIGSFTFGYFADIYGRKFSIIVSTLLNCIAGTAVAVVPNYTCILLLRTIIGFSSKGSSMSCYVLLTEIVGVGQRRFVGIIYQMFFSISLLIIPLLAYFITDWRWLQATFCLPSLIFVCYYWFIPESPRWLISQKKISKAYEIMNAMAKENKREISNNLETLAEDEGDSPSASILDLFRTPNMRKYTLILMFNWFTTEVVYQGLIMRVGITAKNIYVDFLISALVEIPAAFLILFTIERMGRRLPFASSNIVAGLSCLITAFIPDRMYWAKMVVGSIGRLGVIIAVEMVVFVNTELYPTFVRNLGVSICSTLCDIGGIIAPFMLYRLADVWQDLPLIVFGVITLIGGALVLLLPETKGVPLPDTIDDVEFPDRKKTVEKNHQMKPVSELSDGVKTIAV